MVSQRISLSRSRNEAFNLKLISLKDNHTHQRKWPPMLKEKSDDGVGNPIMLLLKDALTQQRNKMRDKFTQTLLWLLVAIEAPWTNTNYGDVTPFKV